MPASDQAGPGLGHSRDMSLESGYFYADILSSRQSARTSTSALAVNRLTYAEVHSAEWNGLIQNPSQK